jgi:hypothetical protein
MQSSMTFGQQENRTTHQCFQLAATSVEHSPTSSTNERFSNDNLPIQSGRAKNRNDITIYQIETKRKGTGRLEGVIEL